MAAEAGVDVVDTAIGPLANLTSQPSMNALVESLRGQERDTGFDPQRLQELADYWADVRLRYESFDKGLKMCIRDSVTVVTFVPDMSRSSARSPVGRPSGYSGRSSGNSVRSICSAA